MYQLIKCVIIVIALALLFAVWGIGVSRLLKIETKHISMQLLLGFFSFFIVMEVIILPVIFLHNSLRLAAILVCAMVVLITAYMLYKGRADLIRMIRNTRPDLLSIVSAVLLGMFVLLAMLQQYQGYDTAYYIGEMASFLYYGEFWTRDAFMGMLYTPTIPLHYALSCFYPFFSILAYIFHVDARLIAMYTARSLCVLLFGCVAYAWGNELFFQDRKKSLLFVITAILLSMFLLDDHSYAFMMMVRGYESKGYCAAIVMPMCALALIRLFRSASEENWKLLGLISWASMPIAMSSMAIVPTAIVIAAVVMMIHEKKVQSILVRTGLCILPNVILMVWYVLGTYLPAWKGQG